MENLATEQRPTAGWSCPTPRVSIARASSPACGSTAPPFWLVNQPGSYGLPRQGLASPEHAAFVKRLQAGKRKHRSK